jgi:iron(III) transport system substrate-binding protein
MKKIIGFFLLLWLLSSNTIFANEVTVYSARKEHLIKPLFEEFSKDTGIKVKYLTGKGETLIERLKTEGKNTKADLFITVDAGNLWYAGNQGLFQPVATNIIKSNVAKHLRDENGLWTGLSLRIRTIVYNSDKITPSELSSYGDLANKKWKNRLCLRTSKKIYNKSLVASIIYNKGEEKAQKIVKGWVDNLSSIPKSKDSHVMDAIIAGQCDVGIINHYYYGAFVDKNPNTPLKLFWANQNSTGVHVNISGAGVLKHSKNKKNAIRLLEWLSSAKAQNIYLNLNKEYPINQNIEVSKDMQKWGAFIQDKMNLSNVGRLQLESVLLMQKQGYK